MCPKCADRVDHLLLSTPCYYVEMTVEMLSSLSLSP